jgi:hypothetical protein
MTEQKQEFGNIIFDELSNPEAKGITDTYLLLSRVHGNHLGIMEDGNLKIFMGYDEFKKNYGELLDKYKRKNASDDFNFWSLDELIAVIKCISDKLELNM